MDTAAAHETPAPAVPLSADELAAVREAAHWFANTGSCDDGTWAARTAEFAARWRATVPQGLSHYASAGERLVETYAVMYASLEADGGIDAWAGSESKTVLTWLVCSFPATDDDRYDAVRSALDVCQWNMGHHD